MIILSRASSSAALTSAEKIMLSTHILILLGSLGIASTSPVGKFGLASFPLPPHLDASGYMPKQISKEEIIDAKPTYMMMSVAERNAQEYLAKGKGPESELLRPFSNNDMGASSSNHKAKPVMSSSRCIVPGGRSQGIQIHDRETGRGTETGKYAQRSSRTGNNLILGSDRSQVSTGQASTGSKYKTTQVAQISKPKPDQVRILEPDATCHTCPRGFRYPTKNNEGEVQWDLIYSCSKCHAQFHANCVMKGRRCPKCIQQFFSIKQLRPIFYVLKLIAPRLYYNLRGSVPPKSSSRLPSQRFVTQLKKGDQERVLALKSLQLT